MHPTLFTLKKEIIKVVTFAKPLKAKIELLHLVSVLENSDNLKAVGTAVKKMPATISILILRKEIPMNH